MLREQIVTESTSDKNLNEFVAAFGHGCCMVWRDFLEASWSKVEHKRS